MSTSELQKNLDVFNKIKDKLEDENIGRTALLHDGKLISIYNDKFDAYTTGCDRFGIGKFSIKTFGEAPISLGIFTTCVQASNVIK